MCVRVCVRVTVGAFIPPGKRRISGGRFFRWKKNCSQNLDSYFPNRANLKYMYSVLCFENIKHAKLIQRCQLNDFVVAMHPSYGKSFDQKL